jgi:hypothetical protein
MWLSVSHSICLLAFGCVCARACVCVCVCVRVWGGVLPFREVTRCSACICVCVCVNGCV